MIILHHRHWWGIVVSWLLAAATHLFITDHKVVAQSTGISLGNLTTRMHSVAGEVFVLSERVLEVRGFVYDGTAPTVYFWVDTNPVPSTNGLRLNDGSPNNGCGLTPLPKEANGTITYRVEFPDDTYIYEFLGGSISLWCETAQTNFGEVIIPNPLGSIPEENSGPELQCALIVEETPSVSPSSTPVSAPITTTPSKAPVVSPTSTTVPTKSTPVSAPVPLVPTSATSQYVRHTVGLRYLVVATIILFSTLID